MKLERTNCKHPDIRIVRIISANSYYCFCDWCKKYFYQYRKNNKIRNILK
jgi:hypothetical protein